MSIDTVIIFTWNSGLPNLGGILVLGSGWDGEKREQRFSAKWLIC